MRLTTKGRFAVTAVLDLAIHGADRPVKLSEISARQGISLSYLEQLFAQERRSGVVRSRRGPGGGYTLGRSPSQLSVADIIRAVDEPIDATQCGGAENCRDGHSKCLTHDLWHGLNDHILRYLEGVTLEQLVRASREGRGLNEQIVNLPPPRGGRERAPGARKLAETETAS